MARKQDKKRYCGWDISLSSTGIAVIDVIKGKPKLVAVTHVPTKSDESLGLRYEAIEAASLLFMRQYGPFDHHSREKFQSRNPSINQKVFGAWSAVDRAMDRFGYETEYLITARSLKKKITGNGNATKKQVEDGVRSILGLPDDFKFKTDDESDAVAVILCHLIEEGIIDGKD